jgi:hypothetical protein
VTVDHGPEVAHQHGHEPTVGDITLLTRIFLSVGTGIFGLAVIYWFASYEEAGSIMLLLASMLVFVCTAFLWNEDRRRSAADAGGHDEDEHYLPHASPWPFGVGLGVFLVANGLILGPSFTVPGAVLVASSIVGFGRQSRYRS